MAATTDSRQIRCPLCTSSSYGKHCILPEESDPPKDLIFGSASGSKASETRAVAHFLTQRTSRYLPSRDLFSLCWHMVGKRTLLKNQLAFGKRYASKPLAAHDGLRNAKKLIPRHLKAILVSSTYLYARCQQPAAPRPYNQPLNQFACRLTVSLRHS